MCISIAVPVVVALVAWIAHDLGSFFDFYGDILSASTIKDLGIKNLISFLKVPIFNKLRDVFRLAKDLIVRSAELYFPDDDPQLAYFRWIYFAEIVCDFDDVKRFDALGG